MELGVKRTIITRTPKNPTNMANIFQISTNSRRKTIEKAATIIGAENMIADVIVNGRYFIAIKLKNVQTTVTWHEKIKAEMSCGPFSSLHQKVQQHLVKYSQTEPHSAYYLNRRNRSQNQPLG